MRFVLAYDIRESSRRARVARHLEKVGQRTQGSVFLLDDSLRNVKELVAELAEWLDPETDCVQAWSLTAKQTEAGIHFGRISILRASAAVISAQGEALVSGEENHE